MQNYKIGNNNEKEELFYDLMLVMDEEEMS